MIGYILIGVTAVLLIAGLIKGSSNKRKHLEEGQTLERTSDFMEYTEIFSLHLTSPQQLFPLVLEGDIIAPQYFKIRQQGNALLFSYRFFKFSAKYDFDAIFEQMPADPRQPYTSYYRFSFTHYRTSNGSVYSAEMMNNLLTIVEYAVLQCDVQATVRCEPTDFRTRTYLG